MVKRSDDEIRKQQRKLEGVAAPLGDSSENSLLLQKLLYESYQGRSTVPVASSTGFPGISVNFRKTLRSPIDRYPCVTAGSCVTLRLEKHTRDVTHGLVFHPIMRCESKKGNHVLNRKKCLMVKSFLEHSFIRFIMFYSRYQRTQT